MVGGGHPSRPGGYEMALGCGMRRNDEGLGGFIAPLQKTYPCQPMVPPLRRGTGPTRGEPGLRGVAPLRSEGGRGL